MQMNALPPLAQANYVQAVPQALGAIPPALQPRPHATFTQLYSDESKDPCNHIYDRLMAHFDAMHVNVGPSNTLCQQAVSCGGSILQAYLCGSHTVNGPRIYCDHIPSHFIGALDGSPMLWDDLSFAFLGEVVKGLISIVSFPKEAFNIVQTQVHTTNYILTH